METIGQAYRLGGIRIPLTKNVDGLARGYVRTYVCTQIGTNKVSYTIVRMYPNMSGLTEWKQLAGHIAC